MKTKLIEKCWPVICLIAILTACNDDEDGGSVPREVNTTYSNLLATGDNPTLALTYSGTEMIGKNIYFKATDAHTGLLSLERIIPGEEETNIGGIVLTATGKEGYSFSGTAGGSTGAVFGYEGEVKKGSLRLALTDVKIPANSLSSRGIWVPAQLDAYKSMSSLTGMVLSVVAYPALQTVINTTIERIGFEPDGNIVARYAGLPEGVGFAELISGKVQPRPQEEWQDSPRNLVTYCVKNDTLLYLYPNIDGIIHRVRSGKGRAVSLPVLSILQVYTKLHTWATEGIKLIIREEPSISGKEGAGRILIRLDKEKIRQLFEIIKVIGGFLPGETMNGKASEWLGEMIPAQYQGMLGVFLKDKTVAQLLDEVYTDLDSMPFYLDLYLSE